MCVCVHLIYLLIHTVAQVNACVIGSDVFLSELLCCCLLLVLIGVDRFQIDDESLLWVLVMAFACMLFDSAPPYNCINPRRLPRISETCSQKQVLPFKVLLGGGLRI